MSRCYPTCVVHSCLPHIYRTWWLPTIVSAPQATWEPTVTLILMNAILHLVFTAHARYALCILSIYMYCVYIDL